jgi:hypothetical protein
MHKVHYKRLPGNYWLCRAETEAPRDCVPKLALKRRPDFSFAVPGLRRFCAASTGFG